MFILVAVKSQDVFDEFKTLSGSVVYQCVYQAMPALLMVMTAVEEATKHLGLAEQSKYTGYNGHTTSNTYSFRRIFSHLCCCRDAVCGEFSRD